MNTENQPNPSKHSAFGILPEKATSSEMHCCHPSNPIGSEQALAPVRYPDTFAEGAWDKLPKTKGTFDFVPQVITFATLYKNYIDFLFGSC